MYVPVMMSYRSIYNLSTNESAFLFSVLSCLYMFCFVFNVRHISNPLQIATLLTSAKVEGDGAAISWNRWIESQVLNHCTANVHLALKIFWLLRAALGHLEVPTRRGLPHIQGVSAASNERWPFLKTKCFRLFLNYYVFYL